MKYIAFYEFNFMDMEKILEKMKLYEEEFEKFPEKFPEVLFPHHGMGGEIKGFEILEATSEQLMNEVMFWSPEVNYKCVPIFDAEKWIELWEKMKK